jgi:hypothetical protein
MALGRCSLLLPFESTGEQEDIGFPSPANQFVGFELVQIKRV